MENNWENNLSKACESYSEAAPEGLWSAVSGTLARQRRRRVAAAWSAGAFASAAVLLALLLLPDRSATLHQSQCRSLPLVAEVSVDCPVPPARALRTAVREMNPSTAEEISPEILDEASSAPESEAPQKTREDRRAPVQVCPEQIDDPFAGDLPSVKMRSDRRLALNMSLSNSPSLSLLSEGYSAMYGSGVNSLLSSQSTASAAVTNLFSGVLLDNNFCKVGTEVRHYQPVRLGLSLAYEFASRFSLVSGLAYTCLVSDMTSGTSDSYYDTRQTLHYVGVPLSLSWSMPLADKFDLYLSAGGMVEKCIAGRSLTSFVQDGRVTGGESDRMSVRPLQWSAKASAGLLWRFSAHLGLYVEPGVVRYFDNGSYVESLYSDRPLNFDLTLGLRFDLGNK